MSAVHVETVTRLANDGNIKMDFVIYLVVFYINFFLNNAGVDMYYS